MSPVYRKKKPTNICINKQKQIPQDRMRNQSTNATEDRVSKPTGKKRKKKQLGIKPPQTHSHSMN